MNKAQDKYQELSKDEVEFGKMNDTVVALSKIQDSQIHWTNVFRTLSAVQPDGITITDFSTKNYQVFLVGKAASRDDLLSFKSQLDASSCFQNVNVPLSDLVVREDVTFQMDFMINQYCLKKQ